MKKPDKRDKFKLEMFWETLLITFFFMIHALTPVILIVVLIFEMLFG